MSRLAPFALILALLQLPTWAATETAPLQFKVAGATWVYPTPGDFQDVKADLVDAIESRGLVVSYIAHTASMLQRTAEAVGAIEQTYDFADTLLFCKADLTYKLTVANPHNMPLCPYSISVYTLMKEPGVVYLAIKAPPAGLPEYEPIHQLLEDIIYDTVAW